MVGSIWGVSLKQMFQLAVLERGSAEIAGLSSQKHNQKGGQFNDF